MRVLAHKYKDYIMTRFQLDPLTNCWVWSGYLSPDGYGCVSRNNINSRAHRVIYELLVADIPEGLVIDHLCRNRACVNPKHMEPVTVQVNGSRNGWAIRSQCVRGHDYTEENTRYAKRDNARVCRKCAYERDRERKMKLKNERK